MKHRTYAILALLLIATLATPAALAYQKKKKSTKAAAVPAGTPVHVRIIGDMSSATARPGDLFHGTLAQAIVSGGKTLYPKGADVTGRVVAAKSSGRLSAPGILELELTSVRNGSMTSKLYTEPFKIEGESHTKSNVTKIGGGAAAGAVIGAIAGGGKGAAIGAAVGAGAGTGVAAATGKKEAKVESEAILDFMTMEPPAAAASSAANTSAVTPAGQVKSYEDDAENSGGYIFSARDRRVIRTCFREHASSLPPGLAKREELPPGLERQLQKNGTLPPGLQKRVQPLPALCEEQLPGLSGSLERVVYGGRVMLIDGASKILDIFYLDDE
ncbi:MAG: hypothetical protein ACRD2R_02275 [Terriglobales bacterium]